MSETKALLNALLCEIYGKQEVQAKRLRRIRHPRSQEKRRHRRSSRKESLNIMASSLSGNQSCLDALNVRELVDVSAMLKVEILMMGYVLERVLISRDRQQRQQEVLCEFVTAILIMETHDAQPKMRFSLSPPPPKVSLTSPTTSTAGTTSTTGSSSINNNHSNSNCSKDLGRNRNNNNMLSSSAVATTSVDAADDAASDYNQWLHAMKLVARLPGGTPPEFRRKLWLSLADKYLKSKNVDWTQQREKCFCEEWREDDEELGIQIVKDLHRTGSNLCTGPAGSINQAKLKRILLGYARYNPEVGYCQGFNMLGALILQVMDKEEEESMKVMIYLVEGVLPTGYFYGSMGGLQADMSVFRELMQTKLPRLAKHLQRLQGPVENAYEPPLTNVFTMQWFLTMFCTCLPMSCVLRVWDLVLIEGSDVLLRTALVLWSLLEERVLNARTADDFYGKMGSFSNELLNGHLIDSNGLIEKVVQLGPIADIKQLRDKHLYHIAPLGSKQGLQLYFDEEEDAHSDDESRMAVATMWGLNWGRRGSVGVSTAGGGKGHVEQKDRLALDISLLKKQYDRLRERQKQAHVILTTACTTATATKPAPPNNVQTAVAVNQLLLGRPAIVTNRGKRVGAPLGAIPPARKPSLPAVLQGRSAVAAERQLRRGETLHWRDTDATRHRRDSLTWKEIKADRAAMLREGSESKAVKSQKLRSRLGKSDSSSYSEDSDGDQQVDGKDGSSSDTSLCDDDDPNSTEQSPKRKAKLARKLKEKPKLAAPRETSLERRRPKSWAPSTHEIPFMLMGTDSGDEKEATSKVEDEDSATESDRYGYARDTDWSQTAGDLAYTKMEPLHVETTDAMVITSTSQLSPLPDIANYLSTTCISPLPTPKPVYVMAELDSIKPTESAQSKEETSTIEDSSRKMYDGVTNLFFERVNSVERPNRLELSYSLNIDDVELPSPKEEQRSLVETAKVVPIEPTPKQFQIRDDNIPGENKDDYKEVLSMTIEPLLPTAPLPTMLSSASRKRRDPRRKTLTRSSTIELEERFLALERRLSQEQPNRKSDKIEGIKHIPSTAALEERFNTLEKQISAEKQQTEIECFEKPERIPSTADLEIRFNALTKQQSSSESSSKAPLELGDKEQPNGSSSKETNDSEKTSKLHKSEKIQSDTKQPANKTEKSDQKDAENKPETEQPRLKKLPSTAELEDRFNALERKMSTQTNSPAKTKKEPPDGEQELKEKPTEKESLIEKDSNNTAAEESKKIEPNLQEEKPEKELVKEKDETPPKEKNTAKKEELVAKTKEPPTPKEKQEVEVAKRKTPPSTEELEKRFNALEKQRSTTQIGETKEAGEENASKTEDTKKTAAQESTKATKEQEEKTQKSIKAFDDKVKSINASLSVEENLSEAKENAVKEKPQTEKQKIETKELPKKDDITTKSEQTDAKDLSKRRASEPPSMEDLEKRYEKLKRRMSSKNHLSTQNETVNEALERIEQEVIAELGDAADEEKKPVKKEPPTTEDLESRYEALHGNATEDSKKTKIKTPPQRVDVAIEAHIPEAPPPPPVDRRTLSDPGQHQQRALIEELQSKIQGQSPGEENLKPSEINPQRRRKQQEQLEQRQLQQRPTPMGDETSEAPANTAYYRSGNYEPWQGQRMVRRFSDLPSRADLENRLQFLEKKLYKKFYKQRCASDSEVASRTIRNDEKPTTSRQAEAQLEQRVLALEKQLSENSLKLLEAMREKAKTQASNDDIVSPRCLSTETETGKELVRYTQNFGELEESDKPINISINIKMLLNKENSEHKKTPESSTEDLRRRLEQLEQQLVEERARNGVISSECELPPEESEHFPEKHMEENEANEKQEKNSHNQSVKCDEAEKLEDTPMTTSESAEPETVKETKTLQNEERAQIRSKEVDIEKSHKEELKVNPETDKKENKAVEKDIPVEEKHQESPAKDVVTSQPEIEKPVEKSVEKPVAEEVKPTKTEESNGNQVIDATNIEPVDPNNKTVVLLMDNEPRSLKVRRLTRANTEELEGLFQALEKQLNDRNLVKSKDGKLVRVESKPTTEQVEQAQAISDLTKEIEDFTSGKPEEAVEETKEEIPNYDWGPNPEKHHLKRKTVYLPSTKELEARFRSLERQIKLLEDVEKIDVEQRLTEIERKIKLQYSLSHEKDLNKYLELCEGKGLDTDEEITEEAVPVVDRSRSPSRKEATKSPYTSPARKGATKSPYTSPARKPAIKSPYVSPSRKAKSPYVSPTRPSQKTPHTSPVRSENNKKKSPYTSPARRQPRHDDLPISDDLEYKYRVLDLVRSKSKDNLSKRKTDPNKKPPIHPLEMLLDPSPDDSEIPTTGELEHRIRLLDEKLRSPGRHKSRSRSPTIDDIKRKKMLDEQRPKTPVHNLERLVSSPGKPEPPTAAELDERIRALEEEKSFDFKTQKDYKQFNQKLKDVISPSVSYEEFKASKSREQSPRRPTASTPKSAMRREENDDYRDYRREETTHYRPTSPKVIRFRDEDEDYYEETWRSKSARQGQASDRMVGTIDVLKSIEENNKILQRILKKTLADQPKSLASRSSEGLDELGCRLMRETSPITRTGTHTGVPLRTGENINERLSSIKNSIKSIDSLCEEKPYQKEKCQRYIDSLFSDSLHFASKKSSAEDLTHSRSESRGRSGQPSIRISSEHRSVGSVESLRTGSPLRAASPPHYRSHRDISRELSPRRRRESEEQEERESSRVRRDNKLPNYFADNRSELSSCNSLTKFHKVDRQLEETCAKYADDRRSASRSPLSSPYESRTTTSTTRYNTTSSDSFPRPISPYRQPYDPNRPMRSNTPVYQPAKLEIRHTTVTSTFYDRFLTEKKIEKQTLSRPPSRSPVISPSATTKSYTDLAGNAAPQKYSRDALLDMAITSSFSTVMSRSYGGSSSNYSYLTTSVTSSADSQSILTSSTCTAIGQTTTSISATTSHSTSTGTSSSAFVPYNFSSSFNSTAVTSSSLSSYSTGVYNPMMSFTLREPLVNNVTSTGNTAPLGQYQYKSNFSSTFSELNKP